MKKTSVILAAMLIFLASCKKDEDDSPAKSPSSNYKVEYLNQDLQGKINGENWKYALGSVTTSTGWSSDFSHFFEISDSLQADSCFILTGDRSKIIFSVDTADRILPTGKYPLSFDWNSFQGRSVTLFDQTPTTSLNTIATEGEYEILSVDTIHGIITGRMDVYADDENFANGNFTLRYCNY